MVYYWIFFASWLGLASLQYINPTGLGSVPLMEPLDSTIVYPPLPYVNYFNYPARNSELIDERDHFYEPDNLEVQRKQRAAEEVSDDRNKRWRPSDDSDKELYYTNQEKHNPLVVDALSGEDNSTDAEIVNAVEKRNFSPWGGKRNKPNVAEHMWSWKRTSSVREPSMPKRVRFSPWGGKRSGQMIYKPGTKSSKIIFSASVPELTRIISNFSPSNKRLNVESFQFVPTLDKRHPIKILSLSTKREDRFREALPFNTFIDNLPKMYRPGHPYLDVNLKKDGKRKVKFSAWGGKRSPPIIGPIWTPASEDAKDSTLDTMVLVRNYPNEDEIKSL